MRIGRAVLDAIVAHARADAPLECCGLLVGTGDLIEAAHPAGNARRSAVSFLVEPADHFTAIRVARRQGREVIGAYHSHPNTDAVPSETDIREAHDPALLHVIVSLAGAEPDVRAYRIDHREVVAIALIEDS
jgi:proteasome lid subunit RPN8/RPN11